MKRKPFLSPDLYLHSISKRWEIPRKAKQPRKVGVNTKVDGSTYPDRLYEPYWIIFCLLKIHRGYTLDLCWCLSDFDAGMRFKPATPLLCPLQLISAIDSDMLTMRKSLQIKETDASSLSSIYANSCTFSLKLVVKGHSGGEQDFNRCSCCLDLRSLLFNG